MLEIYKRMNERIKEINNARKYQKISNRVDKIHANIINMNGGDNRVSVDTEEEYLMLFKILQEKYGVGVLPDEYIMGQIKHESEHVNAAKEICKRHNKHMSYKYGVEFVVIDKAKRNFYFSPYNDVYSKYKFTLEDRICITIAPETLSDGDREDIAEHKRQLELRNQSKKKPTTMTRLENILDSLF